MSRRIAILLFSLSILSAKKTLAQRTVADLHPNIIEMMERTKRYTLTTLDVMPASRMTFRITDSTYTFRKHFLHIADNLSSFYSRWIAEQKNPFSVDHDAELSKAEVQKKLEAIFDYIINDLRNRPANILMDKLEYLPGVHLPKYHILGLIRDHTTHHRAQAVVYLQLNGIQPPNYLGL